ncbi:Fic family protein [Rathayibacter agropyri]|uniref:Fic family protein n=1 Tax=Rathayibacter agropyri TaxID=1634927 RepID=UPI001566B417|nr:Fic family protein [Rathayibacter agropyri]NRD08871.1 Fic family protein [Rathayibacter agropyri]
MLFETPTLDAREREVLAEIEDLKNTLRFQLAEPRRWAGSLRRMSFARNIRGSNSIEGYDAALDDAAAVALGEEPLDASTETRLALEGYRNAMTYVLQLAQEASIDVNETLIKSLHFMMTNYDLKNHPGRWRPGSIFVRDDETGEIVHSGADVDDVSSLMAELVVRVNEHADGPPIVRAAMAHLNLVMIHPFRDGNGRMARCLQSLTLAGEGVLSPVFMSVEEYLGRNTRSYYDVLAEVGGGNWDPARDARPWVRFMLTAHLRQAQTLQRRVREGERLWEELERIRVGLNLHERLIYAMFDAAYGYRLRNSTYKAALVQADEEVSDQTAMRDLARLVDAGLLVANGKARGRYYSAGESLVALRREIFESRRKRNDEDPFAPSGVRDV